MKREKKLTVRQKTIYRQALCCDLPLIEQQMMRVGLYKTARKMNEVVQAIGWECAELATAGK